MDNRMKPNVRRCYGITHDIDDNPIVRVPKVVKVQIGQVKGPDVSVYIGKDNLWKVGYRGSDSKQYLLYSGKDKAQARDAYAVAVKSCINKEPAVFGGVKGPACIERKFPQKLSYFTFSKQNGDGSYEPDFDTIETHGHCPQEIEIVFTHDEPFWAQYQMWSASELRCSGDGINAMRSVALPAGYEDACRHAVEQHQKMFPIVNGCKLHGCQYAVPGRDRNGNDTAPQCKPHGRLQFQLVSSLRLGGTAQFDTTSYRSTSQLFSCIYQFLQFTGNGNPDRGFIAGIPLKLKLTKFKHSKGHAYAVSLEFRAESINAMREKIVDAGRTFRQVMEVEKPAPPIPAAKQIAAAGPVEARQMNDEFNDDLPESDDVDTAVHGVSGIAAATATAESKLAEQLAAAKEPAHAEVIEAVEDPDYRDADENYDPTKPEPPSDIDSTPSEAEMQAATVAAVEREKKGRRKQ
jgi:hypothetical protein